MEIYHSVLDMKPQRNPALPWNCEVQRPAIDSFSECTFSANDDAPDYLESESSNPTSGTIPKQNYNSKRYMHLYVHCSIIYNSQIRKHPKCPLTDEWIMKDYI